MRRTISNKNCNHMIKIYHEVAMLVENGGVAYETPSAIWAYDAFRDQVTLYVKEPSEMTNSILDYNKFNKNFDLHKERILRLTGARPTAYKMTA